MTRLAATLVVLLTLAPAGALAQQRRFPLAKADGLRLQNVVAEPVTFAGRRGLRVAASPELLRRPEFAAGTLDVETLAWIAGLEFGDGTIEAEIAGSPAPGAPAGARGFVGIAFRARAGANADAPVTYDAFYLRPTNGRADEQERRNHSAQYISHPEWTWFRLRRETPSRYESYVDLVPDTWTRIRIVVEGTRARLFVHDQPQPVLVVNDVRTGAGATGGVALWIDVGTVAHFRNVVVTPARAR